MRKGYEYGDVIQAIYRIVGQLEKRFDALREADKEAAAIARADIANRLRGFPEVYATKAELEEAQSAIHVLETEAEAFIESYRKDQNRWREESGRYLSQDYYEQRHNSIVDQIAAVERWQYKLIGGLVFATFLAPLITGLLVYLFTKGIL